jgi:hypothetical protein
MVTRVNHHLQTSGDAPRNHTGVVNLPSDRPEYGGFPSSCLTA